MTTPSKPVMQVARDDDFDASKPSTFPPEDLRLVGLLEHVLGGQYCVIRKLARGGFADVFEVRDLELDRQLAVKVLREDLAPTQGMVARFKQEARALARLNNHPNTIPIHFVGESQGVVYQVLSYVEGPTLADLLTKHGRLEPDVIVPMLVPVLEVLAHAHELEIIHRDIKPDNVMIERRSGRPLLVDFGIAKCLDGVINHTQTGYVVGTPMYMSPEQALGRDAVDGRADIYAFGAMLYQLITGVPPYDGATSQEIVAKHLSAPVPDPAERAPRIPAWLSEVVRRCMAKDPSARYGSAAEVAAALRAGLGVVEADWSQAVRLATALTPSAPAPRAFSPKPLSAPTERLERKPKERTAKPVSAQRRPRYGLLAAGLALATVTGLAAAAVLQRPATEAAAPAPVQSQVVSTPLASEPMPPAQVATLPASARLPKPIARPPEPAPDKGTATRRSGRVVPATPARDTVVAVAVPPVVEPSVPAPSTTSESLPPRDTAPAPKKKPQSSSPLSGFLPVR